VTAVGVVVWHHQLVQISIVKFPWGLHWFLAGFAFL
jgi:hypothetical protein